MQHEIGTGHASSVGCALHIAAAGKFSGAAKVNERFANAQCIEAAIEVGADGAQRQQLLVERADCAKVVEVDAALDLALGADARGQREAQVR